MTPKRRYQAPKVRPRREIVKAAVASVGVVAVTALLVWLLRPGPSGRFDGGGGGLFNRQPRASWLVALAAIALAAWVWWVLTRRHRRSANVLLAVGSAAIVAIAVVAGFVWPGGLLRQYATVPAFDPADLAEVTSTTTMAPDASSTTAPGTETTVPPTDTTGETTSETTTPNP